MLHIIFHFLIPLVVAKFAYPKIWRKAWLVMSLTMLVDLDHLFAVPIYDPQRCSINFHPLHSGWMIAFYVLLLLPPKSRLIGLGLCIHMALDWQDCWFKLTLFN